jgi:carbamoyl-phosphate synthase small subunit
MSKIKAGILALENGQIYRGKAFGAEKTVVGESVFNTSMTGYQEILTDPSYYAQIVTMTAPQIGNYGINPDDVESDCPKVAGFIVRELSPLSSNWRSQQDLDDYLTEFGVPGLSGVDTRTITKNLRTHGALKACLSTEDISSDDAVERAREWSGLLGVDYVKEVTCKSAYTWDPEGKDKLPFTVKGTRLLEIPKKKKKYKVVAYDFGAKYNIFRKLRYHGFDVEVVPADTPANKVDAINPDGVLLSNGPGDPAALTYTHKAVAELIERYPTFGICLGHQIITHALGAKTYKLKFGHRGANQPVKNLETGEVYITSQNHGFAATREELEKTDAIVTEINLNDQTVAGLRLKNKPVFSVQYHPEASPGPHDTDKLFNKFYKLVEERNNAK